MAGVDYIEPTVLLGRTAAYRDWVEQYTVGQGIAVLAALEGVLEGGAGPTVLREAGAA